MKKQYEKPSIIYEGFELSQSIAVGCTAISHLGRFMCEVNVEEVFHVYTSFTCEESPEQDGEGGELPFCYDVPDGVNVVFSS